MNIDVKTPITLPYMKHAFHLLLFALEKTTNAFDRSYMVSTHRIEKKLLMIEIKI